ncbi:hypothetical protein PssvBMR2_gp27 [Pseudomonas phage MR2]|uniref:Uncharacterized protein n=1 Tax=Pseudomonas phage MR2 TaxID=2711170 RepID=A0A6M3T8Y7_9CAUD|nr:hypothetical protein PssvBMR2_gp27 [Pseudomonas phage MR2]
MKATIRKFLLALAHRAIAGAHTIIVREEKALEQEAKDLYLAASRAFELAGRKSQEALQHKFHAQDVDRAKADKLTK